MRYFKRFIVALLSLIVLSAAGLIAVYFVANKKLDEMIQECELKEKEILSRLQSIRIEFTVADITVSVDYSDLVDIQISKNIPDISKVFTNDYALSVKRTVVEESVRDMLGSLYVAPKESQILYDKEYGWYIEHGDVSRNIDVDKACSYLMESLLSPASSYSLDKFVDTATTNEDPWLIQNYEKVEWMNNFVVSYGGTDYIGHDFLYNFVFGYSLDTESIDLSFIKEDLETRYNTVDKELQFSTSTGETVSVPYVTYGVKLNWKKEESEIRDAISNKESLIKDSPAMTGYDDIQSEYIEVSIQDQHVWHYVSGELCCDTDCVTGTKGVHDTPTGVYYVTERIKGKWLTGPTWRSWVDRWMRLTNSGIGLHDASWRKSFGDNIYSYNGSHGCINLPTKYAYSLFDEIENGVAVIVY